MIIFYLGMSIQCRNGTDNKEENKMEKRNTDEESQPDKAELMAKMREEQVKLAAYYRWLEKGKKEGSDSDDWFEAEESLTD